VGWAVLDSCVYIDHWQHGRHELALSQVRRAFIVRHSAVVLSELRRGARTVAARRLVETLHRFAPVVWEPSSEDWWSAARLIRKLGDAQGWELNKRREFQNDALIALTARRYGATVVTTNAIDFRLLAAETKAKVMVLE
jgi:predicted nucleic acid-binding protein